MVDREHRLTVFFVLLLAVGCADDSVATDGNPPEKTTVSSSSSGTGGEGVGGGGGPQTVAWVDCPSGYLDTCATIEVPLDASGAVAGTIEIHLSRAVGADPGPKRALWFLNGGPGAAGQGYAPVAGLFRAHLGEGWDFYTIDHRGTGRSTLMCPDEESDGNVTNAELDACLEKLLEDPDRTRSFTTDYAARDLLAAIDRVQSEGDSAYLWGYSYGSYWGIRALQIDDGGAVAGAFLGGIPAPGRTWFAEWDLNTEVVGQRLADHCLTEPKCAAEMEGDPWARVGDAFDVISSGGCGESELTVPELRTILGLSLDGLLDPDTRALVFPTVRRILRCNPDDVAALQTLQGAFSDFIAASDFGGASGIGYSPILHSNVALSELVMDPDDPYTVAEAQAFTDQSYFGASFAAGYVAAYAMWPRYERDPAIEAPVPAGVPLLSMNGELDARTPAHLAAQFAAEQSGPQQSYVEVPLGGHGMSSACEVDIVSAFLSDPAATPDVSCLDELPPFSTEVSESFAMAYLGTTELWGSP